MACLSVCWRRDSKAARITIVHAISRERFAVGYDNGALRVFQCVPQMASSTCFCEDFIFNSLAHAAAVLSLASTAMNDEAYVLSGGADGRVCVRCYREPTSAQEHSSWKLETTHGGTLGRSGLLIECVAAARDTWAALVGNKIAVGPLRSAHHWPVQYVGPLANVADDLQMLPDGALVTCSFGGLTLWRRQDASAALGSPPKYARTERLAAARPSESVDLGCNGWARSLAASAGGQWLAAGVGGTGGKASLWLWRMADGAEFECGGLRGEVRTLAWSDDGLLCAVSSSGVADVFVWSFGSRVDGDDSAPSAKRARASTPAMSSPAGQTPYRLRLEGGTNALTLSFESRDAADAAGRTLPLLACGGEDGAIHLFDLQCVHSTDVHSTVRRAECILPVLRWSLPTNEEVPTFDALTQRWARGAPPDPGRLERLLWLPHRAGHRSLLVAQYPNGLLTCAVTRGVKE